MCDNLKGAAYNPLIIPCVGVVVFFVGFVSLFVCFSFFLCLCFVLFLWVLFLFPSSYVCVVVVFCGFCLFFLLLMSVLFFVGFVCLFFLLLLVSVLFFVCFSLIFFPHS